MIDRKNIPYRKGVNAIILDKGDKFLLLQLKSYEKGEWSFVGGGVDYGESAKDALYREIKEEINFDKGDFEMIGKSKHKLKFDYSEKHLKKKLSKEQNFRGQEKDIFLLKLLKSKDKIKLQKKEVNKIAWVSFRDLKKYLILEKPKPYGQYGFYEMVIKELWLKCN